MRFILSLAALLLLTSNTLGAGWTAGMEEDEGGPVMMASVEGEGPGDFPPMLILTCSDEVGLRYLTAGDLGGENEEADFLFASESAEQTLHTRWEGMDGAFAAYFPKTDPVLELLMSGSDLLITSPAETYPPQSFTLEGSRAAIETLLATCL